MQEKLLNQIAELKQKLATLPKTGGSPGGFYGPIEEVGSLERTFVQAVAENTIEEPKVVAVALAELGAMANTLL